MSELPFGLASQNTFASLSPADLQSLAKRASVAYLAGESSLNDAIVKLARDYPSISPHQVQRVVEFANQETFARLFSDNEKYASDKNIEFDVADPGDVLLELNNGARPSVMSVPPDEYSSSPVKLAHSSVEADLELARVFGVDPALPGSEMTVKYAQHEDGKIEVLERIFTKEASADPIDRVLESGQEKVALSPEVVARTAAKRGVSPEYLKGLIDRAGTSRRFAQSVQMRPARIGQVGGLARVAKQHAEGLGMTAEQTEMGRNYLKSKLKQANLVDGIAAQPAPAPQPAAPSPQDQMQQMAGGPAGGTRASANGDTHNDQMLELQREIELAKKRQELQKVEQQTIDQMNPGGAPGAVPAPGPAMPADPNAGMPGPAPDAGAAAAPQGGPPPPEQQAPPPEQQGPPPEASGALMAPPGAEGMKMGSALMKQAMAHIKSGRPHSDLLTMAAASSTSLDRIKQATAHRGEYPMANPWGNVIRAKQKLATLLEDVTYARGKNVELLKEAEARFEHMLAQELHGGTNFGEVGHLLAAVNEPHLKTVLASAMPYLLLHGLNPVQAKAEAIQYEMAKTASRRSPNLGHPLAGAYATLCKLADAIPVLETARSQIKERYNLVDKALQGAMLDASSR